MVWKVGHNKVSGFDDQANSEIEPFSHRTWTGQLKVLTNLMTKLYIQRCSVPIYFPSLLNLSTVVEDAVHFPKVNIASGSNPYVVDRFFQGRCVSAISAIIAIIAIVVIIAIIAIIAIVVTIAIIP